MRKILCDRCEKEILLEKYIFKIALTPAQNTNTNTPIGVRHLELDEDCFRKVEKLLASVVI